MHLQTGILPLGAGDATISTCPYCTQSDVEQQHVCHPSLAVGTVCTRISMHMCAPYRERKRARESVREREEEERKDEKETKRVSAC